MYNKNNSVSICLIKKKKEGFFIKKLNIFLILIASIFISIINVKAENAELKEEVKTTSDSVCKLINIVSLAFLDSKGVSGETKLAISKVIGEIETTGVDLNKINKTVESATKVAETTVEAVNKIHDQVEEHIEDSIEVAEGIKETSLDIYNTILKNANEQQA